MILAIDPGKIKSGMAVMEENGEVVEKRLIPANEASLQLTNLSQKYSFSTVVIGESVFGRELQKRLQGAHLKMRFVLISEKDSSWLARERYWQENPPTGWWRLIPISLRVPPTPIDAYAAVILGERFLLRPALT